MIRSVCTIFEVIFMLAVRLKNYKHFLVPTGIKNGGAAS